ncbi:MAG: CPBP family intramembrane glutamic endopeptidase, partial [Pirellulaceae bacterium]
APLPSYLFCLPILLSSVAFSAAHFNHGGGWVAILVLSLGLGLLYHKTHRLLPCILLHMALNATSLGLAYLSTRL